MPERLSWFRFVTDSSGWGSIEILSLTCGAKGALIHLAFMQFKEGRPLPMSVDKLARLCGSNEMEFSPWWREIEGLFTLTEDGYLLDWIEEERRIAIKEYEAFATGARKATRSRVESRRAYAERTLSVRSAWPEFESVQVQKVDETFGAEGASQASKKNNLAPVIPSGLSNQNPSCNISSLPEREIPTNIDIPITAPARVGEWPEEIEEIPEPPKRDPPFAVAQSVLTAYNSRKGRPEPSVQDVKRWIRKDSPILLLVKQYGIQGTVALMESAEEYWPDLTPGWDGLYKWRFEIADWVDKGKPLRGKQQAPETLQELSKRNYEKAFGLAT